MKNLHKILTALSVIGVIILFALYWRIDPIRIEAKQTTQAYLQGVQTGREEEAKQILNAFDRTGELNLANGVVLVPKLDPQ